MPHAEQVFVNDRPVLKWLDIVAMTFMAALFVWLFAREYAVRMFDPVTDVAIIVLLWLLGCAACVRLYGKPRVRLVIHNGEVVIHERWIGLSRVERFPQKWLARPVCAEEKDWEGDPYFRCSIVTPSGRTISFSEHRQQSIVDAARARLQAANS
jgi:hypothetical protein